MSTDLVRSIASKGVVSLAATPLGAKITEQVARSAIDYLLRGDFTKDGERAYDAFKTATVALWSGFGGQPATEANIPAAQWWTDVAKQIRKAFPSAEVDPSELIKRGFSSDPQAPLPEASPTVPAHCGLDASLSGAQKLYGVRTRLLALATALNKSHDQTVAIVRAIQSLTPCDLDVLESREYREFVNAFR